MKNRMGLLFAVVPLLCMVALRGNLGVSVAAAQSNDAKSQFIGSWSLVSFTDVDDEGNTILRYGENAFGRISYDERGRMMVVLMRRGRDDITDQDFFAYTGSYSIDEAAGTVTHHVEACNAPSWVGTDRTRKFEFLEGNRIALRPVEGTSELIWQRED